ncbi:MAG: Mrp/NBP35 family ATP-binding protein [Desulfomonilaceae bacterium]
MKQNQKGRPDELARDSRDTVIADPLTARKNMEEVLACATSLIRCRLAVMSGKGGVGKSTVAVNLASALAVSGHDVGVLDADVHGPDVPMMLGLQGQLPEASAGHLLPLVAQGNIKVMSMGFLLESRDTPVAWRGPLKHRLFEQFLTEVEWGPLDYLVIDLPPGTGDEPLSIAQLLGKPMAAVIVTTPQDVAVLDSRKAVIFAREVGMDVIGIIENMSGMECPFCKKPIDLFKIGGGEKAARELGVPFLGRLPIDPDVVAASDQGLPTVLWKPDSKVARAFKEVARVIEVALS